MMQAKLAVQSLLHNLQRYALFILSSSLLIGVNFIFISILQNNTINNSSGGPIVRAMIVVGLVFLVMLSVAFMFYSNGFLMRQRNRELGVYNILGMTRGDLEFIIMVQNLIMYVVSLVAGLVIGISFQKLAFLALRRLLDTTAIVSSIDLVVIGEVAGLFAVIYVMLFSYSVAKINKLNPINLLKSASQAPEEPKSRWIMGILGIVCLAVGYYLSIVTRPQLSALSTFIIAAILVVIGTYFLFIAGSVIILKALRKNKKFYYKPNHFISVSGMLFRMKQNGAGLASICLLCTSTLVVLVSVISLYSNYQKTLVNMLNYDVVRTDQRKLSASETEKVNKIAKQNHVEVGQIRQMQTVSGLPVKVNGNQIKNYDDENYTRINDSINGLTLADYNRWNNKNVQLGDNELLIYSENGKFKHKTVELNGKKYQVKVTNDFSAPSVPTINVNQIYVVGNNLDMVMQALDWENYNKEYSEEASKPEYETAYNLVGSKRDKLKATQEIEKQIPAEGGYYTFKPKLESDLQAVFGSLLFVGALIGIVMSITTALIIYYKQVSEGIADRGNFATMQKVGLSFKETKKAIHSQVLMVFMLPIAGAVINLGFATPALRSILKLLGMWDTKIFTTVSLAVTAALLVCYVVIYLLTARIYQRMVNK